MKILVTGAHGQLGRCIYDTITEPYNRPNNEYLFASHSEFDITNPVNMEAYLSLNPGVECIINCAGYTNVEGAEKDPYTAFYVNSLGIKNLVAICEKYDIMLFHISTDYVYKDECGIVDENAEIEPLNIYGQSKRDGELHIINSNLKKWFIFRTSWLYSKYPGNFFRKIIDKAYSNDPNGFRVVIDEIGSPTYAVSLAKTLICILEHGYYATSFENGIYNASGNGIASRYDFAVAIISEGYYTSTVDGRRVFITPNIYPITQAESGSCVKRPHYVVLNNDKLYAALPISREHWSYDLTDCISAYEKEKAYLKKINKIMYGK